MNMIRVPRNYVCIQHTAVMFTLAHTDQIMNVISLRIAHCTYIEQHCREGDDNDDQNNNTARSQAVYANAMEITLENVNSQQKWPALQVPYDRYAACAVYALHRKI